MCADFFYQNKLCFILGDKYIDINLNTFWNLKTMYVYQQPVQYDLLLIADFCDVLNFHLNNEWQIMELKTLQIMKLFCISIIGE